MFVEFEETKADSESLAGFLLEVAKEFPEFLLAVAEENWVRGYEQGLEDDRNLMKMLEE